jgi:serpin B
MKRTIGMLLVAVLFAACGGTQQGPNVRDLTAQEQSLAKSSNTFGFKLLSEVVAQSDGGNVFISPLSVSLALGMTYNGAAGSTEQGMRDTLSFGDLTVDEINEGYRGLIDLLTEMDPSVQMEIANSVWYRQGFEVLQTFIDALQTFFDALVTDVDFTDPGTKDAINDWVADKTHDKIKKILERTDANMVMVLINAIYFKGTWTYQFDPDDTRDDTFRAPDGEKTVKMMKLKGELRYQRNQDFEAIDLPYGHGLFSMTLLLPAEGTSVDDLVAKLTDENWAAWMAGFQEEEIDLYLPRFELEWEESLIDVLTALGMQDAFTPGAADFSGIKPDHQMWISEVKHKTYVKVNEEGTEAAAVTAVVVTDSAPPYLKFDRPFLFVIHDNHSQAMLFMGKIVDPPSE